MQKTKRSRMRPWFKKLIIGAILWLTKKLFEPIPVVGAVAEIVAFAV